jgi:hypothetical protein
MKLIENICIFGQGDCGKDTVTKLEVSNSMKAYVENSNETINKIINETMNSVVTDIVTTSKAITLIDNNSANSFFAGEIVASGNTVVNLNQSAKLVAEIYTINKLVSDTESMADLQTKIMTKLQDKMENDANVKAAVDQINSINEKISVTKGPETMVTDFVNAMTAPFSKAKEETKDEKIFRTFIETVNKQSNRSEAEIRNIVKNIVENNIKTDSESLIDISLNASNDIEIRSIRLKDYAVVNLNQKATLENFTKALSEMNIGTKLVNATLSSNSVEAIIEKFNKLSEELDIESKNTIVKLNEEKSGLVSIMESFMENIKNIIIIVAICVVVAVIALVGIPVILKMFNGKSSAKPPSYTLLPAPAPARM